MDALSAGYRTILIDDCCRGTDVHDIENTKEKVVNSHGVVVHSNEVGLLREISESKYFKYFSIGQIYGRGTRSQTRTGLQTGHGIA